MRPPLRARFTTDDPGRAAERAASAHPGHRLQPAGPGPVGYEHERVEAGGVRLDRVRLRAPARWTVAPAARLQVLRVEAGRVRATGDGVERRLAAGDVCLLVHPDAATVVELTGDVALSLVALDLELLHRIGARTGDLRRTPLPPVGAQRWVRSVEHVRSVLDPAGDGAPGPLLMEACGRLLAATALELLDPGPGRGGTGPRPAALQRALAHIEAHADLDPTLDDIAAAAGVSARTLQQAFRKHLGSTPLGHLRRVRLERVHRDLLAADPARDTVGRIAGRWGFTDGGRFARAYREVHGQPPSRTLHS